MNKQKQAVLAVHATREIIAEKRLLILERQNNLYNATLGELMVGGQLFETIELPWKDNQRSISCIPAGVYTWQKIKRTSNGKDAIYIRDVEGRSQILIHQGTKPSHSKGCILIADYQKFHNIVNNKGLIVII